MDRLAAMETFVRVVETGSFSSAARALNVGQPAVSKAIAQMEARLGVRLLMRSTHGLSPTEAGLGFYDRARRAIEEADEAERVARGAGAGLTGRLRVCAAVTFARLHVIPHLPKFLAAHPGLTVDVILDDRVIDLVEEGVDVALRMGSLEDSSSLTARKLASVPHHVVGTAAYFARAGVPRTPADLAGHEAVIYARQGGTWRFRQGSTEVSVSVSGPLRVNVAEGVRAAVLADMGLAIASAWMFGPELASGGVRAVLTDWSLPLLDLWAVYPTGRMPTAKARAFAAFVEAALNHASSAVE
ncbi:MAG TPA: LysR family transcriptional regulator [Acetobacteraceae bacterium]|nr:LysR family transcriptional regulator [Acetobacteraceae bacterium]